MDGGYIWFAFAGWFGCVLDGDGMSVCWGSEGFDRVMLSGWCFLDINVGNGFVCGFGSDVQVVCWGELSELGSLFVDQFWMFGIFEFCGMDIFGMVRCENVVGVQIQRCGVRVLSAFDEVVCIVDDLGSFGCWNLDGSAVDFIVASFVNLSSGYYRVVSVVRNYVCVVRESGAVDCWGSNNSGESDVLELKVVDVCVGSSCICVLIETGYVCCWG